MKGVRRAAFFTFHSTCIKGSPPRNGPYSVATALMGLSTETIDKEESIRLGSNFFTFWYDAFSVRTFKVNAGFLSPRSKVPERVKGC